MALNATKNDLGGQILWRIVIAMTAHHIYFCGVHMHFRIPFQIPGNPESYNWTDIQTCTVLLQCHITWHIEDLYVLLTNYIIM